MNMKKEFKWLGLYVLLGVVLILLGACVSAKQKLLDAGMKPMSSQELLTLFSEKRSTTFSGQKGSGTAEYFPDGTLQATWKGGSSGGTYSIEDDKFCSKMDFRKGVVKCTTWFKTHENTYDLILSDGTKDYTVKLQ